MLALGFVLTLVVGYFIGRQHEREIVRGEREIGRADWLAQVNARKRARTRFERSVRR